MSLGTDNGQAQGFIFDAPQPGNLILGYGNFHMVSLGGTTNAYPGFKRVGNTLAFRYGDDSGDCPVTVGVFDAYGGIVPSSLRDVTAPVYATTITPTLTANRNLILHVGTLTGDVIIAAPTGSSLDDGTTIEFSFTEDATGGHAVTWNTIFRFSTIDNTLAMQQAAQGANGSWKQKFEYDAVLGKWCCVGLTRF